LSLIAHELRSPASIVIGYLRLLQQDADGLTPRQRRMADEAGRACGRMLRILQEVGELASVEGAAPSPAPAGVEVFGLCDEALQSIEREPGAQPSPALTCTTTDRAATVAGNAAWLTRAFGALMNATAREHATGALECHGFINSDDGLPHAVIAIGPHGFAASHDDLLTNRSAFNRWRGGTGLSLPIACRIIEVHGGAVWSPAALDARASVWTIPLVTRAAI
jgi:signal transduction histidine kinase